MQLSSLCRNLMLPLLIAGSCLSQVANALPAYARQTGQACAACHVGGFGPQLTPFGQTFKIGGYTMGGGTSSFTAPVSGMIVLTHEHTSTDLPADAGPHDGPNNNSNLQEASLFLAGRLSEHIGSFAQLTTYSDTDKKFTMDNIDVRYANNAVLSDHTVNYGVSVNNNPTLQDPWNTGPAWRFPYTSSALAPTPGAATLINGGLEHQVLGTTLYGLWDNHVYTEVGAYRSLSASVLDKVNVDNTAGRISGAAPYWRLAYTTTIKGQTLMAGMFGLHAALQPDRSSGPKNTYNDAGFDGAYQYAFNADNQLSLNGSYVHEHQKLDYSLANGESSRAAAHLNELNLNAAWYFQNTYGLTLGYFNTDGNRDTTTYAPNPLDGNRVGKPDSSGYIMQADWTPFAKGNPWGSTLANLRLGAQYVDYSRFNGSSSNYDGSGRNAHDNNTFYLFAWLAF